MRVWIETDGIIVPIECDVVTLYVRVWIETEYACIALFTDWVTLYVRVWIETIETLRNINAYQSPST